MKALVTGAAGFIGSYLAEALLKKGYEVTCLTRPSSNLRWIEHLTVQHLRFDLAEPGAYAGALADFDIIFHVAGATKAQTEREFFRANEECTRNLLGVAAGNTRLKRFVYLSSLAAVGPSRDGRAVAEDTPSQPVSSYGRSKLAGERAVLEYKGLMPVTIIRPPAVYGPRDTDLFVVFKMVSKGVFPYWGRCCYSFLYVEDLVQGIMTAAEQTEAEGKTFFLADDIVYTNDDIAGEIGEALGTKAMKIRLPCSLLPIVAFVGQKIGKKGIINRDRMNDFRFSNWTCDSSRARTELGFKTSITLREGIKWTADWYRIHRWL
ncbi:MAG: NAD-dependent epimerase/dehydratase family protein [Nitrospiraceae bacterium]|nr:NAD-dependent epimerase/dehydratase family protein [Nitrospiraceae bacterium]